MKPDTKHIIRIRVISTATMTAMLAVFKPFGLAVYEWQGCVHLLSLFVIGVVTCMLTDLLLGLFLHKPCPVERLVSNAGNLSIRLRHSDVLIPISRSHATAVKAAIRAL